MIDTTPENAAGKNSLLIDAVCLLAGTAMLALSTWRWNMPIAAWLAPVFWMRFFRGQRRWYVLLLALPCMTAASWVNKQGAWDIDPEIEPLFALLACMPLIVALVIDRYMVRRLGDLAGTLVFPAAGVVLDYALSFVPLGTDFSPAPSQFAVKPVLQLSALTGGWGITFVMLWLAPVANLLWERRSLRTAPVAVYAACIALVLLGGEARLALQRPAGPAARIAGVTIAHARNYWDEIGDFGTPPDAARALAPELDALEDDLFAASGRAAAAGAQIIFWSEGNAVVLPEHRDAFVDRARAFAQEHGIYLVPAYLVFAYGQTSGDNGLLMITPAGDVAYTYTKTKSWYATDSDGILRTVDTPFGRVSTAICFDMDFPGFIRQAAQQGVDIMLVPGFDTAGTRPYHSEVSLMRAVDYGFSVVRQVNEGASMATDYLGNVVAYQDFFAAQDRVLLADVPVRGTQTLYGMLGDYFPWVCVAAGMGLMTYAAMGASVAGRHAPAPGGRRASSAATSPR